MEEEGEILPLSTQSPAPPQGIWHHSVLPAVLRAVFRFLQRHFPPEKALPPYRHHVHLPPQAGLEGQTVRVVHAQGGEQPRAGQNRLLFQQRTGVLPVHFRHGQVHLCAAGAGRFEPRRAHSAGGGAIHPWTTWTRCRPRVCAGWRGRTIPPPPPLCGWRAR